jgi:hypothetical protein
VPKGGPRTEAGTRAAMIAGTALIGTDRGTGTACDGAVTVLTGAGAGGVLPLAEAGACAEARPAS